MGIAQRLLCGLAVVGLMALGVGVAAHTPEPPSTEAFGPGSMNEESAPSALPPAPADTGTSPSAVAVADSHAQATDRNAIKSMLYAAAVKKGINPYLVMGLAWHESGWQPRIVSYAGAVGVMQVMPATAASAGPNLLHRNVDLLNPADNIDIGTSILKAELDRFGNDYVKALVGYYAGDASVVGWSDLTSDERRYVLSVYADTQLFASGKDPA